MKRLLSLAFLAASMLPPVCAQTFEQGGVAYEVMRSYSGSVAVTRGNRAYSGSVNIPSSVSHEGRTYTVRAVADRAFKDSYVSSLTLPYGLSEIGAEAFKGCRSLWRLSVPPGVGRLGAGCFEDCTGLSQADFGYSSSLRELPARCFKGCYSLREVRLPQYITAIGEECFRECRSLTAVEIPYRVETIGSNAFRACRSLAAVTLPADLRRLGGYCFGACYALRTVTAKSTSPYPIYEYTALRGDGTDICRQATLRVPRGSLNNYRQSAGWRDFGKMEEY